MTTRPLPTTIRRVRDLSGRRLGTSAMAESALLRAYNVHEDRLPCACGGWVVAERECPSEGVREHQATERHRHWRLEAGL